MITRKYVGEAKIQKFAHDFAY